MRPRSLAWRTSALEFPSASMVSVIARKSRAWARSKCVRSSGWPGRSGSSRGATRLSPGRSENKGSLSSSGVTRSEAATEASTPSLQLGERAASPKSLARAIRAGTAERRWIPWSPRRTWLASVRFPAGLAQGRGSRKRSSNSRMRRPTKRSRSSTSARNQGRSFSRRKWGTTSSPRTLNLSSDPGSKAFTPPSRLRDLHRPARDQLVDESPFSWRWPEQATDALEMLALAERSANDDGHACVWDVEPFIQHSSGYQGAELASAKAGEDVVALLSADITGERHDEVRAGDRVRALVVSREHERPRALMAIQQRSKGLSLSGSEREKLARLTKRRKGAPSLRTTGRGAREVLPTALRHEAAELNEGSSEDGHQLLVGSALPIREIEMKSDGVAARQEPSREVGDGEFADRRPDQVGEPGKRRKLSRRGCRQTQPSARDRHRQR